MSSTQARQAFLAGYLSKVALNGSTQGQVKDIGKRSAAASVGSADGSPTAKAKGTPNALKNSASSSSYFKYQGQLTNPMTSNGITPVGPLARTPSLAPTSAQSDQKIAGPTTVKSMGGSAITTPNAEAVVNNVAGAQAQTTAMATAPKSPTSWNPQTSQVPQPKALS